MGLIRRLKWWRAPSMAPLRSRGDVLGRLHDRFARPELPDLGDLEVATDLTDAFWLGDTLWPWDTRPLRVGTIVPEGHPAYARVLPIEDDATPGEPSREMTVRLASILGPHTRAAGSMWFLVWEGWGNLDRRLFDGIPRAHTTARTWIGFRGPLDAVGSFVFQGHFNAPSYWWPEDRAWCVATEVDAMSTYVGGTEDAIAAVLAEERFESYPATLTDPFGGGGDPRGQ